MHIIDLVQLVDNDTRFTTNLRNVLEIFVSKSSDGCVDKERIIKGESKIEQKEIATKAKEIKCNGNNIIEAQVPG